MQAIQLFYQQYAPHNVQELTCNEGPFQALVGGQSLEMTRPRQKQPGKEENRALSYMAAFLPLRHEGLGRLLRVCPAGRDTLQVVYHSYA